MSKGNMMGKQPKPVFITFYDNAMILEQDIMQALAKDRVD